LSEAKNKTTRTPLRILNEPSGFMGLTSIDLCVLGYLLVLTHGMLDSFDLGLLSFLFTGLTAYALIAIRLKCRRKIIRDFIFSGVGPKVLYDPERNERF
jgi:hypothetical protein